MIYVCTAPVVRRTHANPDMPGWVYAVDVPAGVIWQGRMVSGPNGRAIIATETDPAGWPGVAVVVSGATWADVVANAQGRPTKAQRSNFDTWLAGGGWPASPGELATWEQILTWAIHLVWPGSSLVPGQG